MDAREIKAARELAELAPKRAGFMRQGVEWNNTKQETEEMSTTLTKALDEVERLRGGDKGLRIWEPDQLTKLQGVSVDIRVEPK